MIDDAIATVAVENQPVAVRGYVMNDKTVLTRQLLQRR
jgi:hypothetical protein